MDLLVCGSLVPVDVGLLLFCSRLLLLVVCIAKTLSFLLVASDVLNEGVLFYQKRFVSRLLMECKFVPSNNGLKSQF